MIESPGMVSSVLVTESYLREDVLSEVLVLDVSTRSEISEEYITKLTETTIKFSNICEDMIERFKGIKVFAIFFGNQHHNSSIYISIKSVSI